MVSSSQLTTDGCTATTDTLSTHSEDTESEETITPEYLDSLLKRAKERISLAKQKEKDVILFDEVFSEDIDEESELPPLEAPSVPKQYLNLDKIIPVTRDDPEPDLQEQEASGSTLTPAPPPPPKGYDEDGKYITKKQRKAMKQNTTGRGWFDFPKPPDDDLPRLRREVQALRLRNAMDPKRFYKRESMKEIPKYFAIGTIVTTATPFGTASTDNLTRSKRKRTIVEEVLADTETVEYTNSKFAELSDKKSSKKKRKQRR